VRSAQKGIRYQRSFAVTGRLSLTGMGDAPTFSPCARVIVGHASKATKGWRVLSVMKGTDSLVLSAVILPSATSLLSTDVPVVQLPNLTAFDANTVSNRRTACNAMGVSCW
jgi:hypothetical protein